MAQKNLLSYCQGTLEQGSVLAMEKGTPIVGAMPFKTIMGNAYSFNVIDTMLPTKHRQLGEDVVADEFEVTKVTKELVILTNSVKTDRALAVMSDITEIKAEGQNLAMVSSGKALEGFVVEELRKFVANDEAGKTFTGALSNDLIDDAVDYVDGATVIFANNKGHRQLKKLLIENGMLPDNVESFGRRVMAYNNIPVHVAHDLADNEILLVKFGEEAVHGITNGGLRVYEKEVGVHHIADTELLYNVVAKTKNAFAFIELTPAKTLKK